MFNQSVVQFHPKSQNYKDCVIIQGGLSHILFFHVFANSGARRSNAFLSKKSKISLTMWGTFASLRVMNASNKSRMYFLITLCNNKRIRHKRKHLRCQRKYQCSCSYHNASARGGCDVTIGNNGAADENKKYRTQIRIKHNPAGFACFHQKRDL